MTGALSFMHEFIEITSINPFLQSFTLPQACLLTYRKNFLKENTLNIIPRNGFHAKAHSLIADLWLKHREMELREKEIKRIKSLNLPNENELIANAKKEIIIIHEWKIPCQRKYVADGYAKMFTFNESKCP